MSDLFDLAVSLASIRLISSLEDRMLTQFIKSAALAAIVTTASIAPASAQFRKQESVSVFYTDESYSMIAGQTILFCDGGRFHNGAYTMYQIDTYYGCD